MNESDDTILVGGIYATADVHGVWRIARVLALDQHAVHLRGYRERYTAPPIDVDLDALDWTIGHMPVARERFADARRVLIKVEPVAEEELEGYREYLAAMDDEEAEE